MYTNIYSAYPAPYKTSVNNYFSSKPEKYLYTLMTWPDLGLNKMGLQQSGLGRPTLQQRLDIGVYDNACASEDLHVDTETIIAFKGFLASNLWQFN